VLVLGGAPGAAYAAQAAATLGAGLLVAVVWRRRLALPIRGAALTAATLVAIPVVLLYDLLLAAVAAVWLIRDRGGLPAWEKLVLAGLFVLSVNPRGLAEASRIPVASLIAVTVMLLAAAHALRSEIPASRYASA
jgi:hypothetical protein